MDLSTLIVEADSITDVIIRQVVTPMIILFIGVSSGMLIKNVIQRILSAIEFDKHAKTFLGQKVPLISIISNLTAGAVYTISTIYALKVAGVLITALRLITGFFSVIAIISTGLWLVDIMINTYARTKTDVKIGHPVSVSGIKGKVISKGLIYVRVEQDNILYDIPYNAFIKTLS